MPIVFWASLLPWLCAIQAALTICSLPKSDWTKCGVNRRSVIKSNNISRPPKTNPAMGDVTMGTTTFGQTPASHFMTDQLPRAVASAAPQRPPMSEWLELEGNPNHQVAMFHANAAIRAQSTVGIVTMLVSTSPLPIVDATAPPRSAPVRLKNAAIAMALRGVRTRVETTVAIAFAASWKPLLYSKTIAARMTEINVSTPISLLRILERDLKDDVSRVPATVDHFLNQFEQIALKNYLLGFVIALVKIAQQIELELVSLPLYRLEFRIHLARCRSVGALAQLFYHGQHCFSRLIEELDLLAKIAALQILRADQNPLADFFYVLRYLIKRAGQRLNVLAFQRRDESFAKLLGKLLRDFLVFTPAAHEFLQTLG